MPMFDTLSGVGWDWSKNGDRSELELGRTMPAGKQCVGMLYHSCKIVTQKFNLFTILHSIKEHSIAQCLHLQCLLSSSSAVIPQKWPLAELIVPSINFFLNQHLAYLLAGRGPMAETSPSHYLPHLNLKTFQLLMNHLLKNDCIGQVLVFRH